MKWLTSVAASHLENSPKPKSIITSLIGGHEGVGQFLTVWERDLLQKPAGSALAKRSIAEHRGISGPQRALGPARTRPNPPARDFEHTDTRGLAPPGAFLDDE